MNRLFIKNIRLLSTVAEKTRKWDLYSGICIERQPVITAPMKEIELQFSNLLKQIEFENSLKSDHELRLENDKTQDLENQTDDADIVVKKLAQDFEDACNEELKNFKFAPRDPDEKLVKDPLKRKLDRHLILLTEQTIGSDTMLLPPQGIRNEGETLRQTAERILKTKCGTDLNVQFYGNAPFGVYKYAYPKKIRESGTYGAKIFYYLVKYKNGNVSKNIKHQWCDREELKKSLPDKLHKSLSLFLIPE
ncbi:large ribosomal subunit protein mL46 [Prorops nasuta]|uniref:large ribosomal subunit protein mL46 n=1 Tax=Prorops nasuta TaxID=863751 RepID=UPI0034CEDAEA